MQQISETDKLEALYKQWSGHWQGAYDTVSEFLRNPFGISMLYSKMYHFSRYMHTYINTYIPAYIRTINQKNFAFWNIYVPTEGQKITWDHSKYHFYGWFNHINMNEHNFSYESLWHEIFHICITYTYIYWYIYTY